MAGPRQGGLDALRLTPQERTLYQHHQRNLTGGLGVMQPNGAMSTVRQAIFQGPNGQYYNVPTIWQGKQLSPQEGLRESLRVGGGWQAWPAYPTVDAAQARYDAMHKFMEQETQQYLAGRRGKRQR